MEVLLLVGCIYFNTRAEKVDVETMGTIGLLLLLIIVASQQLDTKPGSRP